LKLNLPEEKTLKTRAKCTKSAKTFHKTSSSVASPEKGLGTCLKHSVQN